MQCMVEYTIIYNYMLISKWLSVIFCWSEVIGSIFTNYVLYATIVSWHYPPLHDHLFKSVVQRWAGNEAPTDVRPCSLLTGDMNTNGRERPCMVFIGKWNTKRWERPCVTLNGNYNMSGGEATIRCSHRELEHGREWATMHGLHRDLEHGREWAAMRPSPGNSNTDGTRTGVSGHAALTGELEHGREWPKICSSMGIGLTELHYMLSMWRASDIHSLPCLRCILCMPSNSLHFDTMMQLQYLTCEIDCKIV